MNQQSNETIGFVGAGRMASALAKGFVSQNAIRADQLFAFDISEQARNAFQQQTGGTILESHAQLLQRSSIIFLAVKPQVLPDVAADLASGLNEDQLVVSIAAGVTLSQLECLLRQHQQVIRIMPNTPALVGAGAAGMSCATAVAKQKRDYVLQLMKTVGVCHEVEESLLDAVTGLSGSGPAYIFQMIEALSDGGVKEGLPRAVATELAAQTVLGAAKMVLETGEHPGSLKDAVASPAGTTIAAIAALERGGLRAAVIDAVQTAANRSRELSQS